jgi:hypothetical protein
VRKWMTSLGQAVQVVDRLEWPRAVLPGSESMLVAAACRWSTAAAVVYWSIGEQDPSQPRMRHTTAGRCCELQQQQQQQQQ